MLIARQQIDPPTGRQQVFVCLRDEGENLKQQSKRLGFSAIPTCLIPGYRRCGRTARSVGRTHRGA